MSLTAISLFSGAGGMDLGVHWAGFKTLAAIEKDIHCCDTLRFSANDIIENIIQADIRDISPETLMNDLNLEPGELDLLYGGPPCQPFSQIGKRKGLEDERGLLIFEMIRFAEVLRPKAIFMEQVRGLATAKGKKRIKGEVIQSFFDALHDIGYAAKWELINAADFGVPQLRKRLFIVAMAYIDTFSFPQPTHTPQNKVTPLLSLKPYVTIEEVIGDLDTPSPKGSDRVDSHIDVTPERDIERIQHVPEGSYLAAQTHLPESLRGKLTKKDTTKFRRLAFDQPALTLRGGETFYHPRENRYLTPRECLRIHTFPDDYQLKGPIRTRTGTVRDLDQHRQVGNAVPPKLAEKIARHITEALTNCHKSMSCSATHSSPELLK